MTNMALSRINFFYRIVSWVEPRSFQNKMYFCDAMLKVRKKIKFNSNELSFFRDPLEQACQTQTTVRAAHWVLKLEKLTAGCSLEKHATLCQF